MMTPGDREALQDALMAHTAEPLGKKPKTVETIEAASSVRERVANRFEQKAWDPREHSIADAPKDDDFEAFGVRGTGQ